MNSKTRVLLIGGVVGAALGALSGWIYYNQNAKVDKEGVEIVDTPKPGEIVKFAVALLGAMRLIAD
ncbi:MAG: hypothetical protein ACP5JG_16805 [Anaerolineae bacterium]